VAAYCLTNDGTDSYVYYNPAVGQIQTWQSTTVTGMEASQIRVNKKDQCIIYGKFPKFIDDDWTIDQLNGGGGTEYLRPYTAQTGYPPLSYAPGVYNSGEDMYYSQIATGGSTGRGYL